MEKWLDREKFKTAISDFLTSDFPHFLLSIEDSQEFEDITRWIDALNLKVSVAYLNTDSEVTGFGLLESIVEEFGDNNFPHFKTLYGHLSGIDPQIIIDQKMGSQIDSENSVSFTGNTQTLIVNPPDPSTVKRFYFESKINGFLKEFIRDLNGINENRLNLIVCRFKGSGFDKLDARFKGWFQDFFIRKIKQTLIKVIVICETNFGELSNSFDNGRQFRLKNLHLNDIIPVATQYLSEGGEYFCKGAVDDYNEITYKEFKIKLKKNI